MPGLCNAAARNVCADWTGNARAYALAWGSPVVLMVAGMFVSVGARAAVWALSLAWMGAACVLNARRCGRTHCCYTGPFYWLMVVPVMATGFGLLPLTQDGWLLLGAIILIGGKSIWWASERAWGKFL